MGRILYKTLLGIILIAGGVYLAYLYIQGIDSGSTPLLLIPSLGLIGGGVFFLIKAGESNASVISQGKVTEEPTTGPKETLANVLQRNNEIVQKWAQTSQLKDQLKVMQAGAEAEETPQ